MGAPGSTETQKSYLPTAKFSIIISFMSTDPSVSGVGAPPSSARASSAGVKSKVGGAWVVTGLALGGCVAFGLMWQNECRRSAYFQAQVEPLKAEAARYRVGLQEEIARTMRLAEELKNKPSSGVSVR